MLLLLVLAGLIQIPGIQLKVARYATSYVSTKTHTKVELRKINIRFPETIVLEGVYLEDLQKDTLLYAEQVKVNMAFEDLLNHKITIHSLAFNGINVHLNRSEKDSLFNYNFLITAFADTTMQKTTTTSWNFKVDNASMRDIRLQMNDQYGGFSLMANLKQFKIKGASIDLEKQLVELDLIALSKSTIQYIQKNRASSSSSEITPDTATQKNNWTTSIKNINLENNLLSYSIESKDLIKNTFDASHLLYKQGILIAKDLYYSTYKTSINIEKFTAVDSNGFAITEFEMNFKMDEHSISAKKIKAKTTHSSMEADLELKYMSLASLMDSLQWIKIHANVKSISLKNADILYFNPLLVQQPFFRNSETRTTASGILDGRLNRLQARNLEIHTGENTILRTNFNIVGLQDIKTASYHFPNLTLISSRKDIIEMAGAALPASMGLPDELKVQLVFNGTLESFKTTLDLKSSFGTANLVASLQKEEKFHAKINIQHLDLGRLLKNSEMLGPVTLKAEASGQGLDRKVMKARIDAQVSELFLNKYTYQNLSVNGDVQNQEFKGKMESKDPNAMFEFDGLIHLIPNQEHYNFRLNLQGANLQKLHFTEDDTRISLITTVDLKGNTARKINGRAGITDILISHDGKKYQLDSFRITAINEPKRSEFSITSSLLDVKYSGTIPPMELPDQLTTFINRYFPISKQISKQIKPVEPRNFNFEIQFHNSPILSGVFFPELHELEPGWVQGSFDSQKSELLVKTSPINLAYGNTILNNLTLNISSNTTAFKYRLICDSLLNSQIKLENLLLEGQIADKCISANVSSIDNRQHKKLSIRSQIVMDKENYQITLDPNEFYWMDDRWTIAADNYIKIGNQGFLIHHLNLEKTGSQININSANDRFQDDLSIRIKNLKLDDISRVMEKDTSFVKGKMDGNILLKRVNKSYGIIADAQISNLIVRQVPIGDLSVKAENPTAERFDIAVNLSGKDNNLTVNGFYLPNGGNQSIRMKAWIPSLSMQTIQAFSFGQLTEASGSLSGNFLIEGSVVAPEVTGEMVFNDAFITPAMLKNPLELKHETIRLKKDGIYFDSFTVLDSKKHAAILDGSIQMKDFKDFNLALKVNSKDFLVFNTTAKDNKEYFGRMVLDSKIEINGPLSMPVVRARLKMKKGSYFTVAVPEDKITANKGEGIIEIGNVLNDNPILDNNASSGLTKSGLSGFDLSSILEIDKQATLRLLIDPASSDSLVVRGDAALSFDMDRSGKMSLTGTYNLEEGSYLVSLESVIKRKFNIETGSTILWNGDPMDADISINAMYLVQASPIDLVANQMEGLSDADKNAYKQRYPFLVYLKLRGKLLQPEINFEIQLSPENKGILNGAVNAKLNLLNEDPSTLNKQVFALLVLGRFVQENPLQTETSGLSSVARTTVGKLLSTQLNQLSSNLIPWVELNFDIQSYDEFSSGQAQGRTQMDIGVKKQLFNDRLNVQVGGVVDVEGNRAKQNSAGNITSDVALEYKLSKDGRYRLKGFRNNQYEGAMEGQLVETGVGIQYVRDFNKWKYFLKSPKKDKK